MTAMPLKIRPAVKGLLTFVPGLRRVLPEHKPGESASAEYCYGVWLKHLTFLWENGLRSIPDALIELGPGESLGVGLAAMLSGANHYYALDTVSHARTETTLRVFDQLVKLFRRRTGRSSKGWPDFDHYLDQNLFPSHILTPARLEAALAPPRVEAIRRHLLKPGMDGKEMSIHYIVPWAMGNVPVRESVDLILSHAVMEHVSDLKTTYAAHPRWLKPGGMISHQIDFSAHGLSYRWNGFRAFPETLWKIIFGKRPYLINRQPCSTHIAALRKNGLKILCYLQKHRPNGIKRSALSSRWKTLSDDDLTCSAAFIQAQRP